MDDMQSQYRALHYSASRGKNQNIMEQTEFSLFAVKVPYFLVRNQPKCDRLADVWRSTDRSRCGTSVRNIWN